MAIIVDEGDYEPLYIDCTISRLEDELVKELLMQRKYVERARRLLYQINLMDPIPRFEISERDIPPGLANEIIRQGKKGMDRLVTEAVRRVYKTIDSDYYHVSGILGKVRWRFTE